MDDMIIEILEFFRMEKTLIKFRRFILIKYSLRKLKEFRTVGQYTTYSQTFSNIVSNSSNIICDGTKNTCSGLYSSIINGKKID